jgi:hypothetical protein
MTEGKGADTGWAEFLASLREAGGSTDMQTSKTGRYPWLFHFCRGQANSLAEVVIFANTKTGGYKKSPPRDWTTRDKILADYRALEASGAFFNDTREVMEIAP